MRLFSGEPYTMITALTLAERILRSLVYNPSLVVLQFYPTNLALGAVVAVLVFHMLERVPAPLTLSIEESKNRLRLNLKESDL